MAGLFTKANREENKSQSEKRNHWTRRKLRITHVGDIVECKITRRLRTAEWIGCRGFEPLGLLRRLILASSALALIAAPPCLAQLAQPWELGLDGGYGWYLYPTIINALGSAEAGMPAKGAIGVTLAENINDHLAGEVRYLFRFGGPQLRSDGTQANLTGHTNVITYDFLLQATHHFEIWSIRPFVSGGAGIKVFTGTGQRFPDINQPLVNLALLRPITQVEPAISAGSGVKFLLGEHVGLRIELRTYMSPLPDEVFRRIGQTRIRGWLYDFVPLAGVSYVF